MNEMSNQLFVLTAEPMDFPKASRTGVASHESLDQWMKRAVAPCQPRAQKAGRELDGNEAVSLTRKPLTFQRMSPWRIKARRHRFEIDGLVEVTHGASSAQIQAKLQTVRMKTTGPLESAGKFKVVPLYADTKFIKPPIKVTPAA